MFSIFTGSANAKYLFAGQFWLEQLVARYSHIVFHLFNSGLAVAEHLAGDPEQALAVIDAFLKAAAVRQIACLLTLVGKSNER